MILHAIEKAIYINVKKSGKKEIQFMKAAIILQTKVRGVQARMKTKNMKYNIQLLAATIMIQKYMRMAQARILVARMKQKAIDEILFKAACLIQTRVRRSQAKIQITRMIRNKALSKAGTFKKNVFFVSKFES